MRQTKFKRITKLHTLKQERGRQTNHKYIRKSGTQSLTAEYSRAFPVFVRKIESNG